MKDAIGGGILLNIVVIFVSVIILIFASILTYSKAYKVKNRIIEIIEKNEVFDVELVKDELSRMGYTVATKDRIMSKCGSDNLSNEAGYLYCVNEVELDNGKIYKVVTYVNFNIPIINEIFNFPVKGETKVLSVDYNY